MTVATSTSKSGPYAGAGTTGPFTVDFRFLENSHLQVVKTSTAGAETTLVLDSGYTVTGAGAETGTVTLIAPLASGEKLTIIRDVPSTQEADYVQNDAFPAASHETALDKLTMLDQQNREQLARAIKLPISVEGVSTTLPTPVANAMLAWSANADGLQNVDPQTLATIVAFGTANADVFTGDGVTTVYTLTANPGAQANLDVAVGGVTQSPVIDYIWNGGTTVTFTAAPANGVPILLRYFQALPQGFTDSAASTFTPSGAGAIETTVDAALKFREVCVFSFMTASQIAAVRAKSYSFDATPAFAAAETVVRLLGGGEIIAPAGGYRLDGGAASSDGFKSGILFPDTNGNFATSGGVSIRGEGVNTILKAGSANMIVLRASRLYSGGRSFMIDGAGLANVYGLGLVPESMTQTTEVTSQSFGTYYDIHVENCVEATVMQPGPTVLGSDSGGFYHRFYNLTTNLCTRAVWMKTDVTGAGNRTTRASFYSPVIKRGNAGFQIDRGTEIDIYSPNFEFISIGTSPLAVPTAILHNDPNPANIRIFGGYAEACTRAIESIAPQHVSMYSFIHTATKHSSEFSMGRYNTGRLTVPKLLNTAGYINVGGEGFWGFVVDPDQNGSKTGVLTINGVEKERWNSTGSKIFYGSAGNITTSATGASEDYTRAGAIIFSASNASGAFYHQSDFHGWQTRLGSDIFSMSATEFIPRVDNATVFGTTGLRLSAIWAANGTIQTSDPRTKKDIADSPLGLDFIMALRPVAYRFKVGGNKILGEREVTPAVLGEDGEVLEAAKYKPVIEPTPGKRLHYGFLTTDVKAAMEACQAEDFGGYIKTDMGDPESEEALRYEEFIAPLVRAVQQLTARVVELESKSAGA